MNLHHPYNNENIFAKIIAGNIPSVTLYEDDDILSFMDVFPQSPGHALVISKTAKAVNILDIDANRLQQIILHVQKIAAAIEKSLKPDGIRIAQFNGSAAGQTVFHLHFHIIPVFEKSEITPHFDDGQADINELKKLAEKIKIELT